MLNRRSLFSVLGGVGVAKLLGGNFDNGSNFFGSAAANDTTKPSRIMIYIYLPGGWNGWPMGILQPSRAGVANYPRGIFQPGVQGQSVNPFVNRHFESGNFVFNPYSKVLANVSEHLLLATINSRSVGHETATLFQSTGGTGLFKQGTPTWPAGAAHAQSFATERVMRVLSTSGGPLQTGSTATNVSFMPANTMDIFGSNFLDSGALRAINSDLRKKYSAVLGGLGTASDGPAPMSAEDAQQMAIIYDGLNNGIPKSIARDPDQPEATTAAVKNPTIMSLNQELSLDNLSALLSSSMNVSGEDLGATDTLAYLQTNKATIGNFLEKLRVAGLASKSGTANGISLAAPFSNDLHFGGADVTTAQGGAVTLGCIALFWKWIVSQGLHNDVMVVMGSEFSRSPYNSSSMAMNLTVNGQQTQINSPGCDHWPVGYMMLLNGRLKPGRIGGLLDSAATTGSANLAGVVDPDIPGYTSTQIMGSAMLRAWPELWSGRPVANGWRAIKEIWPTFNESDLLPLIVD